MTNDITHSPLIKNANRLVVKVGSTLVTNDGSGIDKNAVEQWAKQIAALHAQNREMVLVSSGAIAEGMVRLGWPRRPKAMHELQAAAAVGQMGLVQAYETAFAKHGIRTAQILLTHEDLADRHRYLNARSTLYTLLALGIVPIVNENDTVITDEIKLGDNDTLGALVTNLIEANALIILTDQSGLYDSDPRSNPNAKFIHHANAGDPKLEQMAGGSGSSIGTGGMITKVLAAKRAANSGGHTVIASGRETDVLIRLASGQHIGTHLEATLPIRSARQRWIANHLRVRGQVIIDAGAAKAITSGHKSLLPIGVKDVKGNFDRGDVVACIDTNNNEVARGLINYSSLDTLKIMGKHTHEIAPILNNVLYEELIHRNNMITMSK